MEIYLADGDELGIWIGELYRVWRVWLLGVTDDDGEAGRSQREVGRAVVVPFALPDAFLAAGEKVNGSVALFYIEDQSSSRYRSTK